MKRLSWFVLLPIFAVSCLDQPDCYQLNNNVAVVAFKIIGGGTDVYDLIGVYVPDADSVFLQDSVGNAAVGLPLNPYAREITYTFAGAYGGVGSDEVRQLNLTYKSLIQFVSEDCGERYVFSDMAVASTDFDSVRILNAVPTRPPSTNLEIYRCPRTNVLYIDFIGDVAVTTVTLFPDVVLQVNTTISNIWLPLNPEAEQTSYLFTYSDGSTNTLTVTYNTIASVLSSKCGEQIFINNIGFDDEQTDFSTVTVKEDSIYDLPNRVNIEITR